MYFSSKQVQNLFYKRPGEKKNNRECKLHSNAKIGIHANFFRSNFYLRDVNFFFSFMKGKGALHPLHQGEIKRGQREHASWMPKWKAKGH